MAAGTKHHLIDRDGAPVRDASFLPQVRFEPGATVLFSPSESYRVIERRETEGAPYGEPVTLVVEPT
jgi:hypothetical protein